MARKKTDDREAVEKLQQMQWLAELHGIEVCMAEYMRNTKENKIGVEAVQREIEKGKKHALTEIKWGHYGNRLKALFS